MSDSNHKQFQFKQSKFVLFILIDITEVFIYNLQHFKHRMGGHMKIIFSFLLIGSFFIFPGCSSNKDSSSQKDAILIPEGCQNHVQINSAETFAKELGQTPLWVQVNFKVNLWKEKEPVKGDKVGQILPGSRAVIIEEYEHGYRIQSPFDKSIGYINKIQVEKTLFIDTKTLQPCQKK